MTAIHRAPLIAALLAGLLGTAAAQDAPAGHDEHDGHAHATPKVAKVGEAAPNFTLKDTEGKEHKLSDLTKAGKIVVLEWFNPDCPVSKAYHAPERSMKATASELAGKGVVWLAVNSGAPGNQGAGVERNRQALKEFEMAYPVLMDEDGHVGKLYAARTTPHMFVIGTDGKLAYAGAIDDGDPRAKGKTNYVRDAVVALKEGKDVAVKESKPFGCSVKYAE
jgi:peroxiredoxin